MCGICGIINFDKKPVEREVLVEMNNSLSHRGPDDQDFYIYKNCGLGHRRLSIIDLSTGHQPLCNEDKTIWVIFNGEIYNYKSLKKYLSQKGHIFKTNTDTEVLVHLYEEFGRQGVAMLEGMFAYAILDQKTGKLFIYRDRLGQKPLCYTFQNKKLVFGSELQSIVKHPEINKEINFQGFHDYLSLLYIPAPNTIYKNIKKLQPATYLELDINTGEYNIFNYWSCDFSKKIDITYENAKVQLRYLLKKAVKKRLMSDVPLGAFLSGGIDSTIISGLMAEISDVPIKTFTIGFADSQYDERYFAKTTSKEFKTEHHEKIVNPADFSIIENLVKNFGEPFADSSMLPTYLLSKYTREKVTVALSGDGADEFFAGYYRYLAFYHSLKLDVLPCIIRKGVSNITSKMIPYKTNERNFSGKLHRFLGMTSVQRNERYLKIISRISEESKMQIHKMNLHNTQEYFNGISESLTAEHPIEQLMEMDVNSYLHNDILTKVDIASMANSLEIRSPFMDHKLVEFANSLPLKYKLQGKIRKRILIDAFSDLIPLQVKKRTKMGFGVPVASWIRNDWNRTVKDLILNGNGIKNCGFPKKVLEELVNNHIINKADNSYILWSLIVFELWYNNFMK